MNCASLFDLVTVPFGSNQAPVGTANFIVGLMFLPLRNFLARGDPLKEGRVFYVFAGALLLSAGFLGRLYRG
jgi:hypothetical protein